MKHFHFSYKQLYRSQCCYSDQLNSVLNWFKNINWNKIYEKKVYLFQIVPKETQFKLKY